MTKSSKIRRRSFLGMIGAMGATGLGSVLTNRAAQAAPPSLNIVNASSSDALVFQALTKRGDYFKSFGVNATFSNMTDGAKVLAGIMSGDGDICGGGGFSGLFPAIERGAEIKIIGGAVLVPPTCLYTKRDDIHSTKDLVGKTIGTGAPGALLHELTVALLIKKGIDYRTVNFVNIGSSIDIFRAVVAGTVDAGLGSNDFYDQQEKYGVHAVSDGALWDELPEYADQAMFASDKAISEKRDAIVRAMAATAKMFRFVTSPNSSDEWVKARAIALGKDDVDASLRQWRFFQTPGRLATNLVLSETNLEYVQKLNVLVGIQQKVLPFDQVADMSLAQDALKLL